MSERAGIAPSAVRYYERMGLLAAAARPGGGQRRYGEEAVTRLRKIEQLKALGLSLEEIASVIDLYFEDPTGRSPKLKVLALLRRHLAEAEQKAAAMSQFRDDLQAHIDRFETWLAEQGADTAQGDDS